MPHTIFLATSPKASNTQPITMCHNIPWTLSGYRDSIDPPLQPFAGPRPPKPVQPRDDGQSRWQGACLGMAISDPDPKPQPRDPGNGRRIVPDPQPRDPPNGRCIFTAGQQPRDGTHKYMSGKPRPPPPPPPAPQPSSPGARRWRKPNDPTPRDPGK